MNNVIDLNSRRPKKIKWPMSKQITVGKNSDGYLILQALQPLFDMGWQLLVEKGSREPVRTILINPEGKVHKSEEGTSLSVALRRMTVGLSKQFSHMQE